MVHFVLQDYYYFSIILSHIIGHFTELNVYFPFYFLLFIFSFLFFHYPRVSLNQCSVKQTFPLPSVLWTGNNKADEDRTLIIQRNFKNDVSVVSGRNLRWASWHKISLIKMVGVHPQYWCLHLNQEQMFPSESLPVHNPCQHKLVIKPPKVFQKCSFLYIYS